MTVWRLIAVAVLVVALVACAPSTSPASNPDSQSRFRILAQERTNVGILTVVQDRVGGACLYLYQHDVELAPPEACEKRLKAE